MGQQVQTWDYDSRTWFTNPATGKVEEYVARPYEPPTAPTKQDGSPLYVHPVPRLYELRPHEFGPIMWRQLHERPFEIDGDLSREKEWIGEFTNAIPCSTCQHHFRQYLDMRPPDLSSVRSYVVFSYNCHNWVNQLLGKPQYPWDKQWDERLNILCQKP